MPIRIRPVCKLCGQAIHQPDLFSPWIHDDGTTTPDHEPMPRIDVVKRGEP